MSTHKKRNDRNRAEEKASPDSGDSDARKGFVKDDVIYAIGPAGAVEVARGISNPYRLVNAQREIVGVGAQVEGPFGARCLTRPISDFYHDSNLAARFLAVGIPIEPRRHILDATRSALWQASKDRLVLSLEHEGYHCLTSKTRRFEFFQIGATTYGTLPPRVERAVLREGLESTYETRGSFDEWKKHVAAPAEGNVILTTSICAAISAPILPLVGSQPLGLDLYGGSSGGKTTTMELTESLTNSPSHIGSWAATATALDIFARQRPHRPVLVDELGLVSDPNLVTDLVYKTANGAAKMRARSDLSLDRASLSSVLIMAGEVSFADLALRKRARFAEGHAVRLVMIPCTEKYGCFSVLHAVPSPAALADGIRRATAKNYGLFWPRYIEKVFADTELVRRRYARALPKIVKKLRTLTAGGTLTPLAERTLMGVANWAFAGMLATQFGLLPWSKKWPIRAVAKCLAAYMEHLTATTTPAATTMLNAVKVFLQGHGHQRFVPLSDYGKCVPSGLLAGFRHRFPGDEDCFLIFPAVFEQEFCQRFGKRAVINVLREARFLIPGEHNAPTKQVKLPGTDGKRSRFYALRAGILID